MSETLKINVQSGVGYIKELKGNLYIGSEDKFEPALEFISKKVKLNIKGVGKRYAPNNIKYQSLNQDVKIANIFNFIDDSFVHDYILYKIKTYINVDVDNSDVNYSSFKHKNYILEYISKYNNEATKNNNLELIKEVKIIILKEKDSLSSSIKTAQNHLDTLEETNTNPQDIHQVHQNIYLLKNKISALQQLEKVFNSKNILIYDKSNMIIVGEALIGKTHTFCDVALKRLNNNQPTLLFFGNQFDNLNSITSNMISQLGIVSMNEDKFLEDLNKLGQEYNTKTLIMIDAINETENSKIWQDGIIKFCEQIKEYQNVAVAFSIRDIEKNKIITKDNEEFITNEIIEIRHKGFEDIELEAVKTFCEALEVEFPKVPIHTYRLFVNPGMLFLYIEIIKDSTNEVDTSIINPLTIFESYIKDLERKYYQRYIDEVDEDDEVVLEAIKEFISLGTQEDYLHFYLDYKDVKKKLKPLHNKILEFLISEGVLNKLTNDGIKVYFTYQKFENFFIADYLLSSFDIHKDKIEEVIDNQHNSAMIEALFMQIPKKLKQEPFEIYENLLDNEYVCGLYLDSLIWRESNSIGNDTFKYIKKIQEQHSYLTHNYLEVILQLSTIPNHSLNILAIHKKLLSFSLTTRDYAWSIYIHNSFINDDIVERIINWAWDKKEDFDIEDESLYLYGLTLGWFLTSSNRLLRDSATKSMVNIFTNKTKIFLKVLKEFEAVNDLYVYERLYTIGYGVVLRSTDEKAFKDLGDYIYKTIFNVQDVIEHILIRDYAKLTIEYIHNKVLLDIDLEKIQPPYNSKMPTTYPSKEEIEKYKDSYGAVSSIISSMRTESMGHYGDFGRYTFQADLSNFEHKDFKIEDLSNYAVKIIIEDFISDIKLFEESENQLRTHSSSRYDHKIERIGKKYQWIALHKILALVADNYKVRDDKEWDNFINYEGVWQLYTRNIDPTTILKTKNKDILNKWLDISTHFENEELSDTEWMSSTANLPTVSSLVEKTKDNKDYLLLHTSFSFDGSKDKNKYRNLYYHIDSFIVKNDDKTVFLDWIKKQNTYGQNKMPQSSSFHNIHLREYPNSKAYTYINDYYYSQMGWEDTYENKKEEIPCKILLTSTTYSNEGGSYDMSIEEGIDIILPNKWFVTKMELQQSLNDGEWINNQNETVIFDSKNYGESVLLANKKLLVKFLEKENLSLFWVMWGEKQVRETEASFNFDDFLGIAEIDSFSYLEAEKVIDNDIRIIFNNRNEN